jgi:hypothetical protein
VASQRTEDIRISWSGRQRCYDNILVERLWRTVKYAEVYLHAYGSGWEAEISLVRFLLRYCHVRPHSSLGGQTPHEVYTETEPCSTSGVNDTGGHICPVKGTHLIVQQLIEELRATDLEKAVISSEDFEYLSQYPKILKGFVSSLREDGFDPVFIVFFRERHAYLTSLAAALANHGATHAMKWYRE